MTRFEQGSKPPIGPALSSRQYRLVILLNSSMVSRFIRPPQVPLGARPHQKDSNGGGHRTINECVKTAPFRGSRWKEPYDLTSGNLDLSLPTLNDTCRAPVHCSCSRTDERRTCHGGFEGINMHECGYASQQGARSGGTKRLCSSQQPNDEALLDSMIPCAESVNPITSRKWLFEWKTPSSPKDGSVNEAGQI